MKQKVYMVCDVHDDIAASIDDCPNVGVEYLGMCYGRILTEDGTELGHHTSTTFGFLRFDLKNKLDNPNDYEIIDYIGKDMPEELQRIKT